MSFDIESFSVISKAPERVDNCSCPLLRLVTYIEGVKSRVINEFQKYTFRLQETGLRNTETLERLEPVEHIFTQKYGF